MSSKDFLDSNKELLIGAVKTKISRLEQKQRWSAKNDPEYHGIPHRAKQIKDLAVTLEWLESGVFND